jgi:hypothetical protein
MSDREDLIIENFAAPGVSSQPLARLRQDGLVKAIQELPRRRVDARTTSEEDAYAGAVLHSPGAFRAAEFPRHIRTSLDAAMQSSKAQGKLWQTLSAAAASRRLLHLAQGNDPDTKLLGMCALDTPDDEEEAPCVSIKLFAPRRAAVAAAEVLNVSRIREALDIAAASETAAKHADLAQEIEFTQQHLTWYLGHDVHEGTLAVGLVVRRVPLYFLQAPTLHEALVSGALRPRDALPMIHDVLRCIRLLRQLFPDFKHNDLCMKNILVAAPLPENARKGGSHARPRGVLTNFSAATSSDMQLQSPFVPHGRALRSAMNGFTDMPSPCFDLHRLWATYRLLVLGSLAGEDPDAPAKSAAWVSAAALQEDLDAVFPGEYFEEPAVYPGTLVLTGPAQRLANKDMEVMTDINELLQQPLFKGLGKFPLKAVESLPTSPQASSVAAATGAANADAGDDDEKGQPEKSQKRQRQKQRKSAGRKAPKRRGRSRIDAMAAAAKAMAQE